MSTGDLVTLDCTPILAPMGLGTWGKPSAEQSIPNKAERYPNHLCDISWRGVPSMVKAILLEVQWPVFPLNESQLGCMGWPRQMLWMTCFALASLKAASHK